MQKLLNKNISKALFSSVNIAPLVVFRIIFGALLLYGSIRFVAKGWVHELYVAPDFYFGYLGFEWVKPLPGSWMYLPFILMIIAALLIILGWKYRWSCSVYFLSFTYVELLDKSNYLNHYYFVSLMVFLMIWLPAHRKFSLDTYFRPGLRSESTTAWTINILKFQLAMVYIFAGIAKINSDWLMEAMPLKIWLQAHHNVPLLGEYLQKEWVAYVFSWAGCCYDLFIVFFLLYKSTRIWAYTFVIIFHLVTWLLFPIGVFPWVMIFSTLIFFNSDFHQTILNGFRRIMNSFSSIKRHQKPETSKMEGRLSPQRKAWITGLISIYVLLQIAVPLRHVFYPGHLFWNEEGFRFSWRVMLMHKEGYATFFVEDRSTGRMSEIDNSGYLTETQEDQMSTQPDMILQYANYIHEQYQGKTVTYRGQSFTFEDPAVRAQIYVSLNGRPSQLFVSKRHDLTAFTYDLKHRDWIEPFSN